MPATPVTQSARVAYEEVQFSSAVLSGRAWPLIIIDAGNPGPRLCVMAGMHINEVSSMEAALRLVPFFERQLRAGRVEIMPVVNVPALWTNTVQTCPVDEKNINFAFPGSPIGSFTPALAHALLNEWAGDASLLIDLHGGDLPTQVSYFTMCQLTGNVSFDAETRAFAMCFDADLHVEFPAHNSENTGRACNVRPMTGKHAVMVEGGGNGLIEEASVDYHVQGVLRCAARLGLVEPLSITRARNGLRVSGFEKVVAPANGRFYPLVKVVDQVRRGQTIGQLNDVYGRNVEELRSPIDGAVVYRITHPMVTQGWAVMAIGAVY
ncbi:hypothetical protein BST63_02785 [Bradyrhizobium canariense]|uniref:Succinylglutamate desuccinylase/Aspartoacylase catalytic domain-containing protein n=1 Tax=Bradyrhizobium canariense TaxID=255045 RepID=A0ABX3XAL4_9BRAD|nr:succinylglutamate desuccinylase/aspartoacylase family protein [Bradyrhizobium canariense]OSJ19441.1 hypothetical protein BSR47_02930 [Bradyrhizobium canariense]OSJ34899.1 hypothetical protein BST63_02785 [Bradyrhizobium canariense]